MKTNRTAKTNLSFLFLFLAFALPAISGGQANAETMALARSSAPTIDGKIEAKEWQNAERRELAGGGRVYFKSDGNYVYVAVQGLKSGWAHLYLSDKENGDVSVMHASAALGKLTYRQDEKKLWQTGDNYVWSLRDRAIMDETRKKMSEYLTANGWLANNNNMGNAGEIEFQFKPASDSFYLAVLFAGDAKNPQFYPKTLADSTLFQELVFGGAPPNLKFNQQQWLKINLGGRQTSTNYSERENGAASLIKNAAFAEQAFQMPKPTGNFPIGTLITHLTDKSRKSPLAADSGRFRELMVQVWYPAKRTNQNATAYIPDPKLLSAMKNERYYNLQPEVLESWKNIRTNSVPDAPAAQNPRRFPFLIFSHGMGVSRSNYTSIIEELASHGYVVAAIDHPYDGLTVTPDGRVVSSSVSTQNPDAAAKRVEAMAQDALFVLDSLTGKKGTGKSFANRIDLEKVGILGHSLGGAAALEVCRISQRFKACADLDGAPWGKVEEEGVNRPYLVMLNVPSEARRPPEAMRKQRDQEWVAIISKKKTRAYIVKVQGTNHLSFSDFPFIVPEDLMKKNGADIKPERGWEIITQVLLSFFSEYLNEKSEASLEAIIKAYAEVNVQSHN